MNSINIPLGKVLGEEKIFKEARTYLGTILLLWSRHLAVDATITLKAISGALLSDFDT